MYIDVGLKQKTGLQYKYIHNGGTRPYKSIIYMNGEIILNNLKILF